MRARSKEYGLRYFKTLSLVSLFAVGAAAAGTPADDHISVVQLQGNVNLSAGNIAGAGSGSGDASSSIGVYAETKSGISIIAAFSFGSKGSTIAAKGVDDYVSFLEQPSSTLGGQIKLQKIYALDRLDWLHYGLATNLRGFASTMTFGEDEREQKLALGAIDISAVAVAQLDTQRRVSVIVEAGMASRLWNRPRPTFAEALDIERSHAYAGPRLAAAISIGDVYAGIEMTRYFGANGLEQLREFAIVPYIGVRGSLDITSGTPVPPQTPSVMQLR